MTLTKAQYDYISKTSPSDMRAKAVHDIGIKTVKDAKAIKAGITAIKNDREYAKRIAGYRMEYQTRKTAMHKYASKRASRVLDMAARHPAHYNLKFRIGDELKVVYVQYKDYDMYAKSYGHPGTVHVYDITIPRTGIKIDYADGILMAYDTQEYKHGLTITHGYINSGKGCRISLQEVYFVHDGSVGSHGKTVKEALEGIRKKHKAEARKLKAKAITLDTKVSAHWYQKITGACNVGTDAWLSAHGYTRKDKITIRQLAEELKPTDFGYHKFMALLDKAELSMAHS